MKEIAITKISVLDDGRLAVFPGVVSNGYEFIYREACGVYWNNKLSCFQSTIPNQWSYKDWYSQILSVVRTGVGIELIITNNTIFEAGESNFKSDIMSANNEVQKWMAEQDKIKSKPTVTEEWIIKAEIEHVSMQASDAFHSKQYDLVINLLMPYKESPYFSKKSIQLLKMAEKYA